MKRYLPLNVQTSLQFFELFLCMAGIGRSGKPEANVAWKFLKEDPP
jgi:hypothetical protein